MSQGGRCEAARPYAREGSQQCLRKQNILECEKMRKKENCTYILLRWSRKGEGLEEEGGKKG
jgi:hypothetical protein